MRKFLLALPLLALCGTVHAQSAPPFRDPSQPLEARIRDLIGRLEFFVVQDMYTTTETAALAHLGGPPEGLMAAGPADLTPEVSDDLRPMSAAELPEGVGERWPELRTLGSRVPLRTYLREMWAHREFAATLRKRAERFILAFENRDFLGCGAELVLHFG